MICDVSDAAAFDPLLFRNIIFISVDHSVLFHIRVSVPVGHIV